MELRFLPLFKVEFIFISWCSEVLPHQNYLCLTPQNTNHFWEDLGKHEGTGRTSLELERSRGSGWRDIYLVEFSRVETFLHWSMQGPTWFGACLPFRAYCSHSLSCLPYAKHIYLLTSWQLFQPPFYSSNRPAPPVLRIWHLLFVLPGTFFLRSSHMQLLFILQCGIQHGPS